MNLNTYQQLAARTAKMYPTLAQNLDHAALGLCTEYFELMGAKTDEDETEELADFVWYVALAATSFGVTLSDLLHTSPEATANMLQGLAPQDLTNRGYDICHHWDTNLGAFTTFVKRVHIYGKEPTPAMIEDAKVTLGNLLLLVAATAERFEVSLASALRGNIDKLKARFPDAYSDAAAEARADKGGLDATVS